MDTGPIGFFNAQVPFQSNVKVILLIPLGICGQQGFGHTVTGVLLLLDSCTVLIRSRVVDISGVLLVAMRKVKQTFLQPGCLLECPAVCLC